MEGAPSPAPAVRNSAAAGISWHVKISDGSSKKNLHPIEAVHMLFNRVGRPGRESL
jgi:hypothetical protein